jgi:hypothetical protein
VIRSISIMMQVVIDVWHHVHSVHSTSSLRWNPTHVSHHVALSIIRWVWIAIRHVLLVWWMITTRKHVSWVVPYLNDSTHPTTPVWVIVHLYSSTLILPSLMSVWIVVMLLGSTCIWISVWRIALGDTIWRSRRNVWMCVLQDSMCKRVINHATRCVQVHYWENSLLLSVSLSVINRESVPLRAVSSTVISPITCSSAISSWWSVLESVNTIGMYPPRVVRVHVWVLVCGISLMLHRNSVIRSARQDITWIVRVLQVVSVCWIVHSEISTTCSQIPHVWRSVQMGM